MMSESALPRKRPNILITGTPGTGKTTLAALVAERIDFIEHIDVGKTIREKKCYDGRDEELDTNVLDEEKLLDHMEVIIEKSSDAEKGLVVDFHMPLVFPERWFDLVLVLRTNTEVIFDRLTARGYNEKKRAENMEAEIMQVILEEAREGYSDEIVHEVPSNNVKDMETNFKRVEEWCQQWIKDST